MSTKQRRKAILHWSPHWTETQCLLYTRSLPVRTKWSKATTTTLWTTSPKSTWSCRSRWRESQRLLSLTCNLWIMASYSILTVRNTIRPSPAQSARSSTLRYPNKIKSLKTSSMNPLKTTTRTKCKWCSILSLTKQHGIRSSSKGPRKNQLLAKKIRILLIRTRIWKKKSSQISSASLGIWMMLYQELCQPSSSSLWL